jgi:hypothetical protein
MYACVCVCVRVCLRADVAAFLFHNAPLLEWIPLNSFWAVSDVFEEGGIRSLEFTNQYGMISINGACGINQLQHVLFFALSLCLSRACLGKMFVFNA